MRKMQTCFVLVLVTITTVIYCTTENGGQGQKMELETGVTPDYQPIDDGEIIEKTIQNIENTAVMIDKLAAVEAPPEEAELLLDEVLLTLEDLSEVLQEPHYAHKFLKADGIKRTLLPYMNTDSVKLKGLVLTLLKYLFYEFPDTAEIVPIFEIDKLLDTFENDDNLAMKAHVLDILYKWLPENPKAQVRVMKLKGLEPFYNQVNKLDTSAISTLLDLFNTILNEHIKAHDRKQTNKMDPDKLILYRRIGLIERMSTPTVCNGLLNIFEATWSYSNDNNDVMAPVFELIKNMKPFCKENFKGEDRAVILFEALLKYVNDENKKDYFDTLDLNVTDTKLILEDFVKELKHTVKDEL